MAEPPAVARSRTSSPGGGAGADAVESMTMALARAAAAGDARATKQLLEMIGPRISAVVRVVLGASNPDVDDVLQQSLIAFVQALPSFRGECEPPRFASRIAVRTAMAARRRARMRHARHDDLVDPDMTAAASRAPADVALSERRTTLIRELLGEIPEEQAESLAMRVVLGWTLEEVASATGAPVNTVRSRLRLAKEALRKRIEADPVLRETLEVEP
jgi:RNA polymerase sigma-70 factor (ECF subfamily)